MTENGRAYNKYRHGSYILPQDEAEQERLDIQHQIFLMTTPDQKLLLVPIQDRILHVLDLGTGTGIWAIDFADSHPEAEVIGVDLSPIQPRYNPPNCRFEADDFNFSWIEHRNYDLIHGRILAASIRDGYAFFSKSFKA